MGLRIKRRFQQFLLNFISNLTPRSCDACCCSQSKERSVDNSFKGILSPTIIYEESNYIASVDLALAYAMYSLSKSNVSQVSKSV